MGESGNATRHTINVQEHLQQVQRLLGKHALVEMAAHQQELPRADRHELAGKLLHNRPLAELHTELDALHAADIAFILEALPIEQRLLVWDLVVLDRAGEILIAASSAVRRLLIATMSRDELRDMTEKLDAGKIARLAPDLPPSVMREVFKSLSLEQRERLRMATDWPEDTVGALMDFGMITIRGDATLQAVLRYLHHFDELPDHTDQLFVVDRDGKLIGSLPLGTLLTNNPELEVTPLVMHETIKLQPEDSARQVTQAFERYGLVSAPVVDDEGRLLGRVTANAIMQHLRSATESEVQNLSGLHKKEDIFASAWKVLGNRWIWLALNLCTAFLASRVIGIFENSIGKLAALAALMPIVAGIAGSSAQQTAAIITHSLALNQINSSNARQLIRKEFAIAALNGLAGGGVAGLFAYMLYHDLRLGLVMAGAILANLLLGVLAAITLPLAMQRLGRNPATGSSLILTAIADSGGFFIFLGLATLFLIH